MSPAFAPLRIGILGTANIARAFAAGVRGSTQVEVVAVASRERSKAQQFAGELGIAARAASYEELLAAPDVEAVYVPLPNSLHAPWSIRAAAAGKHVLCEKPLALTAADARAMFAAAREHGVKLVEAYPYLSQPHALKLRELLAARAIGRLVLIHASFGFTIGAAANIRLQRELGGGSLWDAGCYPVSLVRVIAGARPVRARASALLRSPGVDQTVAATLEFADGLLAQVSCSFGTAVHRHALIAGESGVIQTGYSNHPASAEAAELKLLRGTGWDAREEAVPVPVANGFRAEAESFAQLVRGGPEHWNGASQDESIDTLLALEAIRRSAELGQAVAVGD